MSQIIVTAAELVASAYGYPWVAFAIAVGNSAYQSNEARRRRRDQINAYNAALTDRLEMVDITPEAQRTMALGRVRYVEGIRRRWESGTNSEKLTMVVSFAGHEIDGYEQWYLNDTPVALDANGWVLPTSLGTGAGYVTTATGFPIGTTSIPLTTGSGTILAADKVQFSGDSSIYTIATGISAPGTIVLAAPGLLKALPASATAVTLLKAPFANSARVGRSDSGTMDGSGNATLTLSFTPIAGTATITWTTGSGDTTQQGNASVSVTGTTATITGGSPGASYTCNYLTDILTSYVRIRPYLGTATQSVGADHAAEYPGKLKTTDAFAGIACALVDCIYDPSVFPSGRPTVTAVFRGAKVYDPRLDSTVAGGSGAQRVTDPTTWTWSENTALHAYHYARHANGWNVPNSDIRVSDVMTAATVCDASTVYTLTATGGGTSTVTLPHYRCGITLLMGGNQRDAMDSIVETMAGRWAWSGGSLRMRAGAMAASAFTLDQTWIAQLMGSGGGAVVKGANGISRDQRYNYISGTCIDPDQRYQALPFPAREDSVLVAAKGERPASVSYQGVNHIAHAQHLADIEIREAQAGLRMEMTCNLYALMVELFDVGTINLDRFGMTGKTAEVVGWKWHPQQGITLQLAEITAALFDTSATLDGRDPAPDSILRLPSSVESITGVSVSSGTTPTLDGAILTRTVVSWNQATTSYVLQGGLIEVQYTLAAQALPSGDWPSVTEAGSATQTTIPGLLAGRFYLFRVRAVQPAPALVKGAWTDPVLAQVSTVPTIPVSLQSDGTLVGGAGGQVTLPGLGTTGAVGSGNLLVNADFQNGASGIPIGFGAYAWTAGTNATSVIAAGGPIGSANYFELTSTAAISNSYGPIGLVISNTNTQFGGFKANTNYVFSFYARCSAGAVGAQCGFAFNNYPSVNTWLQNPALTTNWQRYVLLINFGSSTLDSEMFFGYGVGPSALPSGNTFDIACLQIEQGDLPSGWSNNNWASIGGANKPADNATVGAPAGTPVAGTFPGGTAAGTVETDASNGNTAQTTLSNPMSGSNSGAVSYSTLSTGAFSIGSATASISGGQAPYSYQWVLANSYSDSSTSSHRITIGGTTSGSLSAAGTTPSVSFSGTINTAEGLHAKAICTFTDAIGRTFSTGLNVTLQNTA